MLVITRKAGERFLIGDRVVVTVLKHGGSKVTLGIEAPGDVRVMRAEAVPAASAPLAGLGESPAPRLADTTGRNRQLSGLSREAV